MCQSVIKVLTSLKTCVTLPLHTILNMIHAWYMRDIIRNSYVTNAFFIRRYARMSIGSSVSVYVSSRDFCFELLKTFVAEAYALPGGLYLEQVLIKKWMYGDKQCAKIIKRHLSLCAFLILFRCIWYLWILNIAASVKQRGIWEALLLLA